ncbi:hypothetical protein [Caldanaerobacter subterraneus]|uniref:Uncharacterized protein n=1 Tax=Caldanaerobacter subterraneus TaxID=911092 RepID=A0A7Y2PLQ3_9THEO|nr:hypothetical protein [Caldanaerobacter subterraneus]NNG67551.1 hypothetical protein [Caldanaerobacter subterraneus]
MIDTFEIFDMILKLATKEGATPIETMWERPLDEHWTIVVVGKNAVNYKGIELPPYHIYIEFNELPAGLIGVEEGSIADGRNANINSFIKALRKAINEGEKNVR